MDLANRIASHQAAKHRPGTQQPSRVAQPAEVTDLVRQHVWSLVSNTHGDPLAPFALAEGRHYLFSPDATAALSYRVLDGYAVVPGDPIGNPDRFSAVVNSFCTLCRDRGWRIVVLGVSEQRLALWDSATGIGQRLTAIPIGRDVVIGVDRFSLTGRGKRNLRQAVNRTHNAGVTTQIVAECDLDDHLRAELREVMIDSGKAVDVERGFSMMLGGTLSGRYPGVWLIIARDRAGRVQGFHRYATAGGGTDVSLDLPWRRRNAPNGIDERLSIDMVQWAKDRGGQRVSLAFAPFPEWFADPAENGIGRQVLRTLAHIGDRFIKLESLYRYVRKFDALDHQRFVLFPPLHSGHVLAVLLELEFSARISQAAHIFDTPTT